MKPLITKKYLCSLFVSKIYSIFRTLDENQSKMSKYCGRLMPVQAGQLITIQGRTAPSAGHFVINLKNEVDIQFHISVRFANFNAVTIARNVQTKGTWGPEDRQQNLFPHNTANPVKRGGDFKFAIFVDSSTFFVSIDEKPFCFFPHRKPLQDIKYIELTHDVERIYRVDQTSSQPSRWPAIDTSSFKSFAPRPFASGNVVTLTAIPKGNPGDFVVEFYDGETNRTLLHFRVYLGNCSIVVNDDDRNRK